MFLTALALAFSGPPEDPNSVAMWVDDLGRLTPFGRTFDVYIQTGLDPEFTPPSGRPRPPYMIGATRGNETPPRSFSWVIEGEVFKNRRDATYPFLENCTECQEWWEQDTGIKCPTPGAYWDCIQSNPYQRWMYLGQNYTPVNWEVQAGSCCPNTYDLVGLEYFWCDSWILSGEPGRKYGQNQQMIYPQVQAQHKDLIQSNTHKVWDPYPVGQVPSQVCCSSPSQNDYADLIIWRGYLQDWSSSKFPGSFHIARFTGPDLFASSGVVRFACGNSYPCDPSPYQVSYELDNSCPADMDENGRVGFEDLLKVLGDYAGFQYHPQTNNGLEAVLVVLSSWGACS